jgi:hypothetical protein
MIIDVVNGMIPHSNLERGIVLCKSISTPHQQTTPLFEKILLFNDHFPTHTLGKSPFKH